MSNPIISVVMPVYNAEKYLDESIQSILTQTYKNFEFIIINDGSTDKSLDIIKKYMETDERIVLITRENKGLIYSLNEGISKAKGKYIARMDADDISLPTRFGEQIELIEKDNIDICGTSIQLFNEKEKLNIWNYPKDDNNIQFTLMFMSSFAHPTVMIKKSIFDTLKYEKYKHAEDYKLWVDIASDGYKMGNIDKVLLYYRYHKNQVSKKNDLEQRKKTNLISQNYLNTINEETEIIANCLAEIQRKATINTIRVLISKIEEYKDNHNIDNQVYINVLRIIFRKSTPMNFSLFLAYRDATKNIKKDFKGELYLFVQALFGFNRESKIYQFLKRFVNQ